MPPSSRPDAVPSDARLPATARHHSIIEWLRTGRPLTTPLAATHLGVSRRTIARDLAHLRDARGLSIAYDPAEGTYTLNRHHAALPFIPHPDLLPTLLHGVPDAGQPLAEGHVHLRFSSASVQAFEAESGLDLSDAVDAEGQLDVHFQTTNQESIVRWVLSSGGEAEVIAPADLRQQVAVEIRRMLAIYEPEHASAS